MMARADQVSTILLLEDNGTKHDEGCQHTDQAFPIRMLLRLKSIICGRPGIIWGFISGCTFALQASFLHATETYTNTSMALFFRSPILLLSLFYVSWEDSVTYGWYDMFLFITTSVIDNVDMWLFLYAINTLDVGDVNAIISNVTIPSAIIAFIFLDEKLDKCGVILIIINGIGLVLIANPSVLGESSQTVNSVTEYLIATAACVISFLGSALNPNLSRLLVKRGVNNPYLLSALIGFNGVIISSVVLTITNDWTLPNTFTEWLVACALGVSTVVSTATFYKALATEGVSIVAILGTVSIPLTYVYQAIFADEELLWYSVVGALLTVATTIVFCLKMKFQWEPTSN